MSVAPWTNGTYLTYDMFAEPTIHWINVNGGPTSGSDVTVVGSITVPAQPIPTVQIPSVWFNTISDGGISAGDRYRCEIRDDDADGALRGASLQEIGTGQSRISFVIPMAEPRGVDAYRDATFVVTLTRVTGSGQLDNLGGNPSYMTVLVMSASF